MVHIIPCMYMHVFLKEELEKKSSFLQKAEKPNKHAELNKLQTLVHAELKVRA